MKAPRTKFQPGALRMTFSPPRRRRSRVASVIVVIIAAVLVAVGIAMSTAKGDDGVVCVARAELTICPPSNEFVEPRVWLAGVWR